MADVSNIVYQTTTTAGTGNITLVSVAGYRTFISAFPSSSLSSRFYYALRHITTDEWEVGEGYLSGGALVRHTVLKSSNSDSLVNFSAGTKDIDNDIPASLQAQLVTLTADLAGKASSSHTHAISDVTGLQTALDGKVDENTIITGATKTKITYDTKGLVTAGADATTADIADSSNKRYVTDAQLVVIGNTSGTNTGDQNLSGYVPYTGATSNVDLGTNALITTTVKADGSGGISLQTSGGSPSLLLGAGGSPNGTMYGGYNYDNGTADTLLSLNGSKTLTSLSTATYPSLTEVSYVKGVTSAIQTQINSKFTLPSLTSGSVLFSNGTTIAQDNGNFFYNDTTNILYANLDMGTF